MVDFFHSDSFLAMPDAGRFDRLLATEHDVCAALKSVSRSFGMQGFMVLALPASPGASLSDSTIMTDWPDEMLESYDAAGLFQGSPVVDKLQKGAVPFHYDATSTNRSRCDGKADIAVSIFEKYNLPRGAYFPALGVDGRRGAIAFGGGREKLREEEMLRLNHIASYMFNRLGQLRKPEKPEAAALSQRELECIYWVAAGKTSSEIAVILQLSEHTVNHYLNRAGRKLDAVNRVQTVAKAFRAGLIH